MYRILLLTLAILVSYFSSVSQPAYIKGKTLHKGEVNIKLDAMQFNPTTSKLDHEVIKVLTAKDGSFEIEVPDLRYSFTKCLLFINYRKVKSLYLSPGDTIQGFFNNSSFETPISLQGNAAEIANYTSTYYELFEGWHTKMWLMRRKSNDIPNRFEDHKQQKLKLLNGYFSNGLDSAFYGFEKQRIHYEHIANVLEYNVKHGFILDNKLEEMMDGFTFNIEHDLVTYGVYRIITTLAIDWKARQATSSDLGLLTSQLKTANNLLGGSSLNYYYFEKMKKVFRNQGLSESAQNVLVKTIINSAPSTSLKNFLTNYSSIKGNRDLDYNIPIFPFGYAVLFLSLVFLSLLLLGISKYNRFIRGSINLSEINFFRLTFYLSFVGLLVSAISYLSHEIPIYGINPMFIVLITLVFLLVQIFVLIPKLFMTGRYGLYGLISFFFVTAYIWLQYNTLSELALIEPYYYAEQNLKSVDKEMLEYLFTSLPFLFLLGFMGYYEKQLLSNGSNRSFWKAKYTIDHKEFLIHFVIMTLLYIPIATQLMKSSGLATYTVGLICIGMFYLMTYYLIPRFLFKKRLFLFFFYCFGLVILVAFVFLGIDVIKSIHFLNAQGIYITYSEAFEIRSINFLHAANTLIMFIPAIGLILSKEWIINQKEKGFQLFRRKEAELEQLKSQVNPHFLFNTLNTLYAFALKENNDKTAESIGQLANLMRFLVDDMEKDFIPLTSELGYIKDYIKLQSLRSSVNHEIDISESLDEAEYPIAPMLLIPFVENAFKHGVNPNKESSFIFNAKAEGGEMQFLIENTIDENFEAFYKEKGFGIGIQNVKKRLQHLYPEAHSLSIAETETKFIVILNIKKNK